MTTASERHNELAPRLTKELIAETEYHEGEAMVVLESIILGVMLFHAPIPSHADAFLSVMKEAVLHRLQEIFNEHQNTTH